MMFFRKRPAEPDPDDAGALIGAMLRYCESATESVRAVWHENERLESLLEFERGLSDALLKWQELFEQIANELAAENAALRAKLAPLQRARDPKTGKIVGSAKS
jgi:adenylosuccinate lyase